MASRVVDILLEQGRNQAAAQLASGQAWAGAAQQLGQLPGQVMQLRDQQRMRDLQQQHLGLQVQQQQMEMDATQRALQGQKQANDLIANFPRNQDGTFDAAGLLQGAASKDVPLDQQEHLMRTVDGINGVITSWNTARTNHAADLADTILKSHSADDPVTADSVHVGMAAAKALGLASADDEQRLTQALAVPGADPAAILRAMRQQGAKYKDEKPIVIPQGGTLVTPQGQTLSTGAPKPKTEVEVAMEAAGNDPVKAMGFLKPQAAKEGTPEQQYLQALQEGDQAKAANILKAIKETTAAKQMAAPTEDMGVQAETRTTATGRSYVDLSKYKGKDYHAAQQQARAQGVFGANAAESDALQNIDVARQNVALIGSHLDQLASGPMSRLVVGPTNELRAYFQTNEDLAAWGTWRTAAIQAMRALAGSKGLRINQAEIEASTQNDIPKITDSLPTAREKLQRVTAMLTSQENGVLGRPGGAGGGTGAGGTAPLRQLVPGHPNTFAVSTDGGKTWKVE